MISDGTERGKTKKADSIGSYLVAQRRARASEVARKNVGLAYVTSRVIRVDDLI